MKTLKIRKNFQSFLQMHKGHISESSQGFRRYSSKKRRNSIRLHNFRRSKPSRKFEKNKKKIQIKVFIVQRVSNQVVSWGFLSFDGFIGSFELRCLCPSTSRSLAHSLGHTTRSTAAAAAAFRSSSLLSGGTGSRFLLRTRRRAGARTTGRPRGGPY